MLMHGAPAEQTGYVRNSRRTPPWAVFTTAWTHRRLIARLARREVEARYKGSALGILWMVLLPLLMLGVYTFVFGFVLKSRWDIPPGGKGTFFLLVFAGIIWMNLFIECAGRASTLVLSNVTYIKKVVFPLEILPYVLVVSELVTVLSSGVVLAVMYLAVLGRPPQTYVWLPVVVAPLFLMTLGWVWWISSLGVFLRDLRHVVVVLLNLIPFLSPLFYPLSRIPEPARWAIYLSPLTVILEQVRAVLFWGQPPDWIAWSVYFVVSWLVAWSGLAWFRHAQTGFADVV
ncbi:MAG: ABC transporter permease [Tepidisphaeraceae bacterium]|jgi:lipopolysaccharide transport system permease protein